MFKALYELQKKKPKTSRYAVAAKFCFVNVFECAISMENLKILKLAYELMVNDDEWKWDSRLMHKVVKANDHVWKWDGELVVFREPKPCNLEIMEWLF